MNYILFQNNMNMHFFTRFTFAFNYLKRLGSWFNEILFIYIEIKDLHWFIFEFSSTLSFISNGVTLNQCNVMKDSWILNTLPTKKVFNNRQTITDQCYNQPPEHFTKGAIKIFSENKRREENFWWQPFSYDWSVLFFLKVGKSNMLWL